MSRTPGLDFETPILFMLQAARSCLQVLLCSMPTLRRRPALTFASMQAVAGRSFAMVQPRHLPSTPSHNGTVLPEALLLVGSQLDFLVMHSLCAGNNRYAAWVLDQRVPVLIEQFPVRQLGPVEMDWEAETLQVFAVPQWIGLLSPE